MRDIIVDGKIFDHNYRPKKGQNPRLNGRVLSWKPKKEPSAPHYPH